MTKAENKFLGKRLNALRKEQQISSNALAEICAVDPTYIRMIESGSRTPSMAVFIKLCNALRISPGYLLADSLAVNIEDQYDALCGRMRGLTPKQAEMAAAMIETMRDKLEQ